MSENQTIGPYLKALRENRGITIEGVAQKTRINITLLRSLESGKLEGLPDLTYVRGFVKSYCRELSGNLDQALEVLNQTYHPHEDAQEEEDEASSLEQGMESSDSPKGLLKQTSAPKNSAETSAPKSILTAHASRPLETKGVQGSNKESSEKTSQAILLLSAFGALMVILIFVLVLTRDSSNSKQAGTSEEETSIRSTSSGPTKESIKDSKEDSPSEAMTVLNELEAKRGLQNSKESTDGPNSIEEPRKELAKNPGPTSSLVKEEKQEEKQEEVKDQEVPKERAALLVDTGKGQSPTAFPQFSDVELASDYKFIPLRRPNHVLSKDAPETQDTILLPQNIRNSYIQGKQNLYLTAVDGDSWINYKIDQGPIKAYVLSRGGTLLIRGDEIRIFLGNTGALQVFLNNQLVQFNASSGVKSLVFPEEAAAKYVTPLFVRDKKGQTYTSFDYLNAKAQKIKENLEAL